MNIEEFLEEWHNDSDCVLVHTSGSTGQPQPLWVEKRRMEASARLTCQFFGLQPGDTALLCMPLDYIAGKMMVVRAITCGLKLISVEPNGHPMAVARSSSARLLPEGRKNSTLYTLNSKLSTQHSKLYTLNSTLDFVAMVPLQVYNTLQVPEERERLMQVRHLLIGGGPIDDRLEAQLRTFPHAVWSSYGMTETLSHIALRRVNGPEASEWYTPLPTVALSLNDDGCLVIDAPQVCPHRLTTNDLAELRSDGIFRILGRRDNVVCSGGIKIQLEEAERLIAAHTSLPFQLTRRPDEKFGEILVLLCTSASHRDVLQHICSKILPPYWQPRAFIIVDRLPLTATGKPARAKACELAETHQLQKP